MYINVHITNLRRLAVCSKLKSLCCALDKDPHSRRSDWLNCSQSMFFGARKGAAYIVVLLYAAVLARFSNATNPGECSLGKVNRLCCMFLACFTSWRQRRVAPCVLRYSLEYERHLYIFLCVLVYICIYLFSKLCPMFVIYNFPIVNAVPFLFETMQ